MPFGSLFDASSKSENTDNRVAVTDQGNATLREGTTAQAGAVAVGKQGKLNTGIDLSRGTVKGNLVLGDSAAMLDLANLFSGSVSSLGATFGAAQEKTQNAQTALVDKVLASVGTLAETKVTDGESNRLRVLWWGVIAAAGVAALYLYRRR